jgi:hypothetical protein
MHLLLSDNTPTTTPGTNSSIACRQRASDTNSHCRSQPAFTLDYYLHFHVRLRLDLVHVAPYRLLDTNFTA